MKTYIGTKVLKATPMNRQEYNDYRGWNLPANENGADEGMLVEYIDGGKPNDSRHTGYISWSPTDVFNNAYMEIGDNNTITEETVNSFIKSYDVVRYGDKTTVVHARLANGFLVTESSSCVDPANFSMEIGSEICKKRIRNKVWELLGFVLQCGQRKE